MSLSYGKKDEKVNRLFKWIYVFAFISIITTILSNFSAEAYTLRQVVEHTINTNPEILRTAHVRQASRAAVGIARAGYFPVIDGNAGVGRQWNRNLTTAAEGEVLGERSNENTLTRRELGIVFDQNIFEGFFTVNEVKRNKYKTNADAFEVWGTAESTAIRAVEAYLNILRDRELVRIARQNYYRILATYRLVKERGLSGVGREADISQAESRLALASSNWLAEKGNLRDSISTFYRVTGMPPTEMSFPEAPHGALIPNSLQDALNVAVNNNPFLRESIADIAEAKAQHDAAASPYWPRIDGILAANDNRNIDGARGPDKDALAFVELRYNLFRGGADLSRRNETAYELDQSIDIRNRTMREVIESARLTWTTIITAEKRIPQLRKYKIESSKTVVAYREQFKLGKRTLLDLLDAENELFDSNISYTNERFLLLLSKYRILANEGRLLAYLNVAKPTEAAAPYHERYLIPKMPADARPLDAMLTEVPVPPWHNPEYFARSGTLNDFQAMSAHHKSNRRHYRGRHHHRFSRKIAKKVSKASTHTAELPVENKQWSSQQRIFAKELQNI